MRTPAEVLVAELGVHGARSLALDLLHTRATNRVLADTTVLVSDLLAELQLRGIWLKHAALLASGLVVEGQREARDVDVLVAPSDAPTLQAALCARGFRPAGKRAPAYHLVSLVGPGGACVEVHYAIWGVALSDQSAPPTSLDFERAELTVPVAGSSQLSVPKRELLAANTIVHALVQHLTSPDSYTPIRALADLIDLRLWELETARIHRLIGRHVDHALVESLFALCKCLSEGADPNFALADDPSTLRVLGHVLAASADTKYQAALRVHRLHELHERGEILEAARRILATPFSNPQDVAYVGGTSVAERWHQARQLLVGGLEYARRRLRG